MQNGRGKEGEILMDRGCFASPSLLQLMQGGRERGGTNGCGKGKAGERERVALHTFLSFLPVSPPAHSIFFAPGSQEEDEGRKDASANNAISRIPKQETKKHKKSLTLLACLPGPPRPAETDALGAPPAPAAVRHRALLGPHVALCALPTVRAVAATAAVHAVAGAQHGAHA